MVQCCCLFRCTLVLIASSAFISPNTVWAGARRARYKSAPRPLLPVRTRQVPTCNLGKEVPEVQGDPEQSSVRAFGLTCIPIVPLFSFKMAATTLCHVIPAGVPITSHGPQPVMPALTSSQAFALSGAAPSAMIDLPRVMSVSEAGKFRRQRATGRERKRAGNIRSAFTALAECLPDGSSKRLSRLDILQAAAKYIDELNSSLSSEVSAVMKVCNTPAQPATAKTTVAATGRKELPIQESFTWESISQGTNSLGKLQHAGPVFPSGPLQKSHVEEPLACLPPCLSDTSEVMSLEELDMDLNELLSDSGISSGESASPIAPFLYETDPYWSF